MNTENLTSNVSTSPSKDKDTENPASEVSTTMETDNTETKVSEPKVLESESAAANKTKASDSDVEGTESDKWSPTSSWNEQERALNQDHLEFVGRRDYAFTTADVATKHSDRLKQYEEDPSQYNRSELKEAEYFVKALNKINEKEFNLEVNLNSEHKRSEYKATDHLTGTVFYSKTGSVPSYVKDSELEAYKNGFENKLGSKESVENDNNVYTKDSVPFVKDMESPQTYDSSVARPEATTSPRSGYASPQSPHYEESVSMTSHETSSEDDTEEESILPKRKRESDSEDSVEQPVHKKSKKNDDDDNDPKGPSGFSSGSNSGGPAIDTGSTGPSNFRKYLDLDYVLVTLLSILGAISDHVSLILENIYM